MDTDFNSKTPLVNILLNKDSSFNKIINAIAQVLRMLGMLSLIAHTVFFLKLALLYTPNIIESETQLLRSLENSASGVVPTGPGQLPINPAIPANPDILAGPLGGLIPIHPVAWFFISIIAAIYFAFLISEHILVVIREWVKVFACTWKSSFLSFLFCLYQLILALLSTMWLIVLVVLFLFSILIDLVALSRII